ncbi:MAG: CapA family protein [Myxococcota bacterium]
MVRRRRVPRRGRRALLGAPLDGAGVVNLEGPVGPGGAVRSPGAVTLTQAPAALDALRPAGIVAAGLANNHAADAGPDGPRRTAEALRGRGVQPFGGAAGSAVLSFGATTVSLSAFTLPAPPMALPEADLRVVSLHDVDQPALLAAAVDAALDAGAQVVVVQGSHAVGRVERRRGAVVAWGLGDLAFACDCTDSTDGLVLRIELGTDPPVASVIPVAVGRPGAPAALHPAPDRVYDRLEALGSSLFRAGASAAL